VLVGFGIGPGVNEVAGGDREPDRGGCLAGRGGASVGLDACGLAGGEAEGAGGLALRVFARGGSVRLTVDLAWLV
jgi:hypothetical protein